MPGNQGEEELKVGYMVKRSQGKSTLGATNFKKRVFVLTPTRLSYYDGTPEKRGELKGFVELSRVTVVEKVVDTAFDKPSLQISHNDLTLYIVAKSTDEQEEWVDFIRHYCNVSTLQDRYHPGVFTSGKWTCCGHKSRHSQGCSEASHKAQPPVPLPSAKPSRSMPSRTTTSPSVIAAAASSYKDPIPQQSSQHKRGAVSTSTILERPPLLPPKVTFEVVASFDYKGEKGDLPFKKGQVLTVLDDTQQHWWKARDSNGNEGTIPSNYVKKQIQKGLDSEEWYSADLSRVAAETLLKDDGKEGCFVVRNSSREKSYTLSLLHDTSVRHYHIKQQENGEYFISEKHSFPSIKELVEYHKLNGGGLSTRLRKPPANMTNSEPTPVFDEEWEIDKTDLELGKELGSGQFGRVIAGKWKSVDVAIKMMKEGAMNQDDFIAEAKVMKAFKHDNLVRLYGVCTKDGPMFIVTEYMVHGCLLQYVRQRRDITKMTDSLVDMAVQICSAMSYLEVNGFIHRDLAARNCLVGERNIVKVADFGLARFVTDDEYTASEGTKFPIKWAAPEVITYAKFSSKSDVWSYGILLWELWTGGKTPYPTFSNSQVLDQVLMGYRLEQPKDCTPEIYQIMYSTWQGNPEARPSFQALLASLKQMLDYSDTTE